MVQIPLIHSGNQLFQNNSLPDLLYAGQINEGPNWSFSSHKHDDLCEIIYISKGEGLFIIGNNTYKAIHGDILIYNQGVIHEEQSNPNNPLKTYFCGIGSLYIQDMFEGCLVPDNLEPVIHAGSYSFQIENYLSTIFEEMKSQVLGYELVCQNALISLIISVIRILNSQYIAKPSIDSDSLGYKIKEFIDKNYTRNIPLNEIANQLYLSPHYLSHIFKEEIGNSPINYLIQRRIGEAQKLLLNTDLTVQEISQEVGYENANYFSMIFKKVTGKSPSLYRKSQRGI
ncbi:MAG: helix-turn-helix transcriptional regulator [Gorillibacterium sp.]|nr:helix-turn-helix transcriptional regulator [Gorillibacterium sp.]